MKKDKKWTSDGMHMLIDTPHKKFNAQTTAISTGNVMGGTQTSTYVRPWTETECNGFANPPGHLQEFDLKTFALDYVGRTSQGFVRSTLDRIRKLPYVHDKSVIVYMFFHWNDDKDAWGGVDKKKFVHGFVVTDTSHMHLESFIRSTHKSFEVVFECRKYVCANYDDEGNLVTPLYPERRAS